jgi:hypothetical protein
MEERVEAIPALFQSLKKHAEMKDESENCPWQGGLGLCDTTHDRRVFGQGISRLSSLAFIFVPCSILFRSFAYRHDAFTSFNSFFGSNCLRR